MGSIGRLAFSSVTRAGLEDLKEYLWKIVDQVKREDTESGETDADAPIQEDPCLARPRPRYAPQPGRMAAVS